MDTYYSTGIQKKKKKKVHSYPRANAVIVKRVRSKCDSSVKNVKMSIPCCAIKHVIYIYTNM